MPFTKHEEGAYTAVITVEDESERFEVYLTALGKDPNDEKLQVVQMYFVLGRVAKGSQIPPALVKQIGVWNADLTLGKVIAIEGSILYTTSSWFSHTDAESLSLDAVMGHITSKDLRKEVTPYLKQ